VTSPLGRGAFLRSPATVISPLVNKPEYWSIVLPSYGSSREGARWPEKKVSLCDDN